MKTSRSESPTGAVLPKGVRWLAIGAGLVTAVTFIAGGLPGLLLASMLIVGAAVQPYARRAGKWLLIAGAFSVTFLSAEAFIVQSIQLRGSSSSDFETIGLPLFLLVLTTLIVWCDIGLIVHAIKSRSSSEPPTREYFHPLNWLVWLTAAGASGLFIPLGVRQGILLLRHVVGTGLSDVPFLVLPGLALSVLDGALLIQGIKEWHAHLSQRDTPR
ncbi:MAG TPA: hypothetical protein VN682_19035 [Terriglobales bacterium]|nr:hypothetical protein [Terriglobales bacterium]